MENMENVVHITVDFWRVVEVISVVVAACGAGVFGLFQYKINKRLQKLQDYVALTIVPMEDAKHSLHLHLKNAGRLNVYIWKIEIGDRISSFEKPRLIAAETKDTAYDIPIPSPFIMGVEAPVKFYLTDEFGEKYLSTGAIIIDAKQSLVLVEQKIGEQEEPLTKQQTQIEPSLRAWSYKTERYDWKI